MCISTGKRKIEREEERRGREKTDNWLLEKNKQNEKKIWLRENKRHLGGIGMCF